VIVLPNVPHDPATWNGGTMARLESAVEKWCLDATRSRTERASSSVGKTAIWRLLKTGDLRDAQQPARLERVKLDAKRALLRRRLVPDRVETLSDVELRHLVTRRFVWEEKKAAHRTGQIVDLREAPSPHRDRRRRRMPAACRQAELASASL
jgi:hypothetical protein